MQQYTFATVGDLIDQSRSETLGSVSSSLTALQDKALIKQLDRINKKFIRSAHTEQDNEGWSWMHGQDEFKTHAKTSLSAGISEGNGTVSVADSSAFPTSGRLAIETNENSLDFVDYSANAANVFTVDTGTRKLGVTIDHLNGETVYPMYALPSDFAKIQEIYVNGREYSYVETKLLPPSGKYTVVDGYLLLPDGHSSEDITLQYEKKATDLYTGDTGVDRPKSTDIPEDFERYAVEQLNSYIFMKRRKREDAAAAMQIAQVELDDALAYDMSLVSGGGLQAAW